MEDFNRQIRQLEKAPATDIRSLQEIVATLQDLIARLEESGSFIECLASQNMKDEQAKIHRARLSQRERLFIQP